MRVGPALDSFYFYFTRSTIFEGFEKLLLDISHVFYVQVFFSFHLIPKGK